MRSRTPLAVLLALAAPLAIAPAASAHPSHPAAPAQHGPPGHGAHHAFGPDNIALPNGFGPEGVTIRGTSLYAGSLVDGDIYRADLRTGKGSVFINAPAGRMAVGINTDDNRRLFVAGGQGGTGYVYDLRTGAPLVTYQFAPAGASFINDVTVAPKAAYFTDSSNPVLYRVPLGKKGTLPPASGAEKLTVTGPAADDFVAGQFNFNGIVYSERAQALIVVNTFRGALYRIDPKTGASIRIDLAGKSVANGDGLVLEGRTLYVVQNFDNQIGVVELSRDLTKGIVKEPITDPRFRIPTTAAQFGPFLYAVNARFDVAPPGQPANPNIEFNVIRVRAVRGSHGNR